MYNYNIQKTIKNYKKDNLDCYTNSTRVELIYEPPIEIYEDDDINYNNANSKRTNKYLIIPTKEFFDYIEYLLINEMDLSSEIILIEEMKLPSLKTILTITVNKDAFDYFKTIKSFNLLLED